MKRNQFFVAGYYKYNPETGKSDFVVINSYTHDIDTLRQDVEKELNHTPTTSIFFKPKTKTKAYFVYSIPDKSKEMSKFLTNG